MKVEKQADNCHNNATQDKDEHKRLRIYLINVLNLSNYIEHGV